MCVVGSGGRSYIAFIVGNTPGLSVYVSRPNVWRAADDSLFFFFWSSGLTRGSHAFYGTCTLITTINIDTTINTNTAVVGGVVHVVYRVSACAQRLLCSYLIIPLFLVVNAVYASPPFDLVQHGGSHCGWALLHVL